MNKQFIPYELALKLRELGFDKKCTMSYNFIPRNGNTRLVYGTISKENYTPAPLWQQVFDWFYEKFGLFNHIEPLFNVEINGLITDNWCIVIRGDYKSHVGLEKIHTQGRYNSNLKCLEKLIELCETQKN